MFIGALLGPLSKTAVLFEVKNKNLKIVLVGCLVVSVLIGNWLVPILGGVNR
jgi:predicted PurR-regulated permease PerM